MIVRKTERAAAAVEFALVAPVLIALLLGTIEFGFLIFLSSAASGAAREGARAAAISGQVADAVTVAKSAYMTTTGRAGNATVNPAGPACTPGEAVVVTVTENYGSLTTFFGSSFTATGRGEMRCGG
ncbi:TadE/TadG family type IV pilus assembly protein [Tessaracoccus lapidicaptus]|uniref:TadE/TadG family type IV pilus assembly protein n=1 Tax=Tessaracoccus lapidicaptus TaxID=1427523 RepID=UPI00334250D4